VNSYEKISSIFLFKEKDKATKRETTQQTITTLQFNQGHMIFKICLSNRHIIVDR